MYTCSLNICIQVYLYMYMCWNMQVYLWKTYLYNYIIMYMWYILAFLSKPHDMVWKGFSSYASILSCSLRFRFLISFSISPHTRTSCYVFNMWYICYLLGFHISSLASFNASITSLYTYIGRKYIQVGVITSSIMHLL